MQHEERELVSQVAARVGLALSAQMEEMFAAYRDLLVKWNATTNLVSRADESRVVSRHFAESLLLVPHIGQQENGRLLDVGSGAGFPGLPLSICLPHLTVDLLEPRRRASSFLKTVVSRLGLPSVGVIRSRIQDIRRGSYFLGYDTIVTRALGSPEVLLSTVLPLLRDGGRFVAFVPDNFSIGPNWAGLPPDSVNATIHRLGFPDLTCQRSILAIRRG